MSTFYNRDKMWFGTISPTFSTNMRWIDTPNTGADVSSLGASAEETLVNGGGYARNSWDSHKTYQFSWGESTSPQLVSTIQGYRNGSFGRDLLYFIDPMTYGTNVLPKRWADPSMANNYEAESLWFGQSPRLTPTGSNSLGLPSQMATYDLEVNPSGADLGSALTVPVPPNFTAGVGWVGTTTTPGGAGVYVAASGASSTPFSPLTTPLARSGSSLMNNVVTFGPNGGLLIFALYNITASPQTISIAGITVRMAPPGETLNTSGPWMSGEGHSGCRFVGTPTVVNYNGIGGGQMGLSCVLKETGAWA